MQYSCKALRLKWNVTLNLCVTLFLNPGLGVPIVTLCLLQALCKLSELDSSEISMEYKDPTDAYVVGDVVRGN